MDWKRANELFDVAIQLREDAREGYLQSACDDDADLLGYVRRLLSVDQSTSVTTSSLFRGVSLEVEENTVIDATVGSYRISRRIGHGGMGGVYLAHRADDAFQKTVAIKILNHGLDAGRFQFERQVLAKLEHPNIARLLDGGNISDGRPFVVMEYVAGTHIDEYVSAHKLDLEQRLQLFCELCAGVEHAHKNLIVHRDLKPANVLVSDTGIVKLLDFGIAKLVGEDQTLVPAVTHSSARPMTPDYASPEQIFSEAITTQSDVYSLGILLYKVLTGSNPNSNVKLRDRVELIARNAGLPPASCVGSKANVVTDLSRMQRDEIDKILAKATCAAPARRYESVQHLRADLENFLLARPILARGPNPWYRARKFVRRNFLASVSMLALLAILVLFSILTVRQNQNLKIERDTSRFLTDLMIDAIGASDPIEGGGLFDLEQAVARGVLRLNDPRLNNTVSTFRIRLKVGLMLLQSGSFDDARTQLLSAQRLLENKSLDISDRLELNRGLAYLAMVDENHELALALIADSRNLQQGLPAAKRNSERDLTLDVYAARANRRLGQILPAKLSYARALETSASIHGVDTVEHGELLLEYASALLSFGQPAAAEKLFAKAGSINSGQQPNLRSWHYFVKGMADYRLQQREYDAAAALFQEGYLAAVQTYGKHSVYAAAMLSGLGSTHFRLAQYAEAERFFREAQAIVVDRRGVGSTAAVRKSLNLAQSLKRQDRFAEAIAVFAPSIRAHRQTESGLKNADVPFYLLVLARIYRDAGLAGQAIKTYEESLDLQAFNPDSADKRSEVAQAECELAALLTGSRESALKAQLLFHRCLPALAKEYGPKSNAYQAASAAAQATGDGAGLAQPQPSATRLQP